MFRNPTTDLIIVLVIVLLIFGPKRLPGLGRQLGQGLREFKDSITGDSGESSEPERPEIARTAAAPVPGAPAGAPAAGAPAREPADVPAAHGSAEVGSERSS
jgi:sec-independent protein translocase protein TatA